MSLAHGDDGCEPIPGSHGGIVIATAFGRNITRPKAKIADPMICDGRDPVISALVRAMIHSRLDYCNSLLAGLPTGQMSRLRSVLRAAARLVLGLPGRAPVSAAMHDTLHWLSFPQRETFKICLLTYKTSARSGTRLPVALLHVTDLRSWPSSVKLS